MKECILIVNRNGQLSACPTREQYEQDHFVIENMVVFDIEVSPIVLGALKLSSDKVWFAGEGLPMPEQKPGRTYLVVYQGRLFNMKKGV